MDLIIQPPTFTLCVGHFDTVLKIKEQIQKEQGIPVSTQTLVFDGDVLDDELELFDSDVIHGSHIQLIINTEESSTHFKKIVLRFKMPSSELPLEIKMDTNDAIRSVKERLHAILGRFILRANGIELHDDKTIHDSALHHLSEIEVKFEPLRVFISICDTKRIPLVVNPDDEVAELRNKLEKLNQDSDLDLPPGFFFMHKYFFIHKQRVMDDDLSFRWHCVKEDDVIVYFSRRIPLES